MARPLLLSVYRAFSRAFYPFAVRKAISKLKAHGTAPDRFAEKRGIASAARPQGRLIWFHAASVGESLSVLDLIAAIGARLPKASFLITSGTPTSADLIAKRLPPRSIHQFAPLDAPKAVTRFLGHWQPDAALFVESELWPNMISQTAQLHVPMGLINARMSERSRAAWQRRPETARALLSFFTMIRTQEADLAPALVALGAPHANTRRGTNLKSLAHALPQDQALIDTLRKDLNGRPCWIGASTHPGEETILLDAHAALLKDVPDLCLILAPRHPARGAELRALVESYGWAAPQRSKGEALSGALYLADTLGELGSLFALSSTVCLGGAFEPHGGHNPFEVISAGAAVVTGPNIHNFQAVFDELTEAGIAHVARDAKALAGVLRPWLTEPDTLTPIKQAIARRQTNSNAALAEYGEDIVTSLGLDHG